MDRTNRFYKIFITSMIVAIAIMLLASGIIALSKSMKLNLSFQANPNFHFEVYIQPQDSQSKNLVFRNFKKGNAEGEGIVMKNGLSTLKANTLSADSSFVDTYGSEFSIIIANYTAKDIKVLITSTATTSEGAGVPATIEAITPTAVAYSGSGDGAEVKYNISVANNVVFPQETFLEMIFSEQQEVAVTAPETSVAYTFTGAEKVKEYTNYTATLLVNNGYAANVEITTKSGKTLVQGEDFTWDEETGELVINSVTEELTITPEWGAKLKTGLEITDILYEVFSTSTVSSSANIQPEEVVAGLNDFDDGVSVYAPPSEDGPIAETDLLETIILGNYDQYPSFKTATASRNLDVNNAGDIKLYRDGGTAYILSENKIFANEDSSRLLSNNTGEGINALHHAISDITLDNLDTSKVQNMSYMFDGFKGDRLDLSSFDTSNVTSMDSMFSICSNLTNLDLSSFDTSNVTSMQSMFSSCINLTSLDLSNFNTSKVSNMAYMFEGCNKLTSLDLSSFDASNVTSMRSMFSNCFSLTELDLSNFDTSRVTNMSYMFSGCSKLTTIKVSSSKWTTAASANMMFANCGTSTLTYV